MNKALYFELFKSLFVKNMSNFKKVRKPFAGSVFVIGYKKDLDAK